MMDVNPESHRKYDQSLETVELYFTVVLFIFHFTPFVVLEKLSILE